MTIFRWPGHGSRVAAFALAALAFGTAPVEAQTLAAIKQRGALVCGVSEGFPGFSAQTDTGWAGFDVDLCRALAAAVLGDAGKVRYVSLNANDRFAALQAGRIDVLSRNSTWTMSRGDRPQARVSRRHLFRRPGLPDPPDAVRRLGARTR
jgi:general L-amino acid transport system substrate-binding protein